MIRTRIACLVALLAASLPAWAMYGFQPPQTYFHSGDPSPWQGEVVLVEDVNRDGLDDVLLVYDDDQATPIPPKLAVFLQDSATHALDAPTLYPVVPGNDPFLAFTIESADFDGDGHREIVIGHSLGYSVLSPRDGFSILATGTPQGVAGPVIARAGDFNGDAKPDIALLSGITHDRSVWIYAGEGTGHFGAAQQWLAFPDTCCFIDMRPLDFDGDGRLDLALLVAPLFGLGNPPDFGFNGYANDANSGFRATPALRLPFQTSTAMGTGDLDGDGRPDLLGGLLKSPPYSLSNGATAYLHGRLGRRYLRSVKWQGEPGAFTLDVKAGDMDADGRTDLVFVDSIYSAQESEQVCRIGYVPAAGKRVYRYRHSCPTTFDGTAIGDINGDGLQDVVNVDAKWGLGWSLGSNAEPILNLVVGEGFSPGAVAFNLTNASSSATIAAPSIEITYSVSHGEIELTDWPQECSRPDPQVLRIVCSYPDLPAGQSAGGIVHYGVLQVQPYMQLHATAKATTTTEETVTSDNTVTAATWISQP